VPAGRVPHRGRSLSAVVRRRGRGLSDPLLPMMVMIFF
jgi:hypothetical protein